MSLCYINCNIRGQLTHVCLCYINCNIRGQLTHVYLCYFNCNIIGQLAHVCLGLYQRSIPKGRVFLCCLPCSLDYSPFLIDNSILHDPLI
jgi:hypothetical protein